MPQAVRQNATALKMHCRVLLQISQFIKDLPETVDLESVHWSSVRSCSQPKVKIFQLLHAYLVRYVTLSD